MRVTLQLNTNSNESEYRDQIKQTYQLVQRKQSGAQDKQSNINYCVYQNKKIKNCPPARLL